MINRKMRFLLCLFVLTVATSGRVPAEEMKMELNIGDKAPDFTLKNHDGELVTLSSSKEKKWAILAFFPKAKTPG